ncbi:bifunctional ADP-dependent NAD(P)H-hydrate dehydratase/NAD(P)H-hydrate epimerase [Chryseotalea sanaruensis]|uniref:Bifunctional NAD(P)H-hydrate repair enzyme n=1 Tax=Chryseotalea sanaruensis TaxID=2482724 RepID=A0A401UBH8_9BACT|nr:NAD(P)H-hydrate dehydratase [Chryseotalea sanaruensis]GCC52256.1 bifunctional ADP-dependent NAD(P)H-hydrate dehydratase/NAD(P)H-hydrate epimerase [Chryseotalea sanaruensis]
MLKILTAEQIRALDAHTIMNEPITSVDLMERAGQAFVSWFCRHVDVVQTVGIICGTGNNGGDGLVIARLLLTYNYKVKVWIVRGESKESTDFTANLNRIATKHLVNEISNEQELSSSDFTDCHVLIDALFGTGLSRKVVGLQEAVIKKMNDTTAYKIAVDVPSGLQIDKPSIGTIFKADFTLTFQLPKLAFLLPENFQYVGNWQVVRIGLDKKFIETSDTKHFLLEKKDVKAILKPRNKFDHKGNNGKALLIAGSYGKMGAAILAARAAMRTGLGLLTTHVPSACLTIIQNSAPESMASVDGHEHYFTTTPSCEDIDAVGVGPGIGLHNETKRAFEKLLQQSKKPLVVDADAITLLANHPSLLLLLPPQSILTPHPGEFRRLVGDWANDFDRLEKQKNFSKQIGGIVVLKGAHTSITSPNGKVYFNSSGNPGMATAGSGDVLTGMIMSLLAQGYKPLDAAIVGVFLHGWAGDLAVRKMGEISLIASDIIDFIPPAYHDLR